MSAAARAEKVLYVDVTVRQVHDSAKLGVRYGYSVVKGLNALLATASTPLAASVIVATRLRRARSAAPAAPPDLAPTPS